MLETIFLLEEERENFISLALLGIISGIIGFSVSAAIFPSEKDVLAVVFAAIPLIYSLNEKFLDDESKSLPHIPEIEIYLSIFAGIAVSFAALSFRFPEAFEVQSAIVGATGGAIRDAGFSVIVSNNLTVFSSIFLISLLVGSAGAFILAWNASVFGVFMAEVFSMNPFMTLAYLPHSLFEMSGFVIAGISGTLFSAAVYREHFDRETWKDYIKLVLTGISCILLGALLETA